MFKFQFLIGSLKTSHGEGNTAEDIMFQFLIGSLKTLH